MKKKPEFEYNCKQAGDALTLLRSLPTNYSPLVIFDPQHRSTLDRLKYGNEGARQQERYTLPAMTDSLIDNCCREIARVLRPSGYLPLWADDFRLLEGYHLRFIEILKPVAFVAWDNERMGMGYRTRHRGDNLIVLQKPPIHAKKTWTDHGIANRWSEKVDRKIHPHIKPFGLISRLIGAVTRRDDLIIDPCAGSFMVMRAAHELGRNFIGCDITHHPAPAAAKRSSSAGTRVLGEMESGRQHHEEETTTLR